MRNLILLLFAAFTITCSVHGQNQTGFISLDCGLSSNSTTYTEPITGIHYVSDASFVDTGITSNISIDYMTNTLQLQLWTVRSFPQGLRNCYKINVTQDIKYLIRASFLYADYDGASKIPGFDLYLGPNFWDSVVLSKINAIDHKEIIHIPTSDNLHVCLVNTGLGTPFISALELRPLNNTIYVTDTAASLALFLRLDFGSTTNQSYRYKDDVYDRIWYPPVALDIWRTVSTNLTMDSKKHLVYQPPSIVMNSAAIPSNESAPLLFSWIVPDNNTQFYVYMYFAEVLKPPANQSREFNISLNGVQFLTDSVVPDYLYTTVVYSTSASSGGTFHFILEKTENSTLPPLLNAIEVYSVLQLPQSESDPEDVEAMTKIKSNYGITRNWQGDPCAPKEYIWSGLNCNYDDYDLPRIISLNLSSTGLTGEILSNFAELVRIETLDLSNNNLSGSVPDFLSQLSSLRVLNLERNNLSGLIPQELTEKSKNGLLLLSVGENPNLEAKTTVASKKKKKNVVAPVAASIGGVSVLLLLIAAFTFWNLKKRKSKGQGLKTENMESRNQNRPLEYERRRFTYSEVLSITNNFRRTIGEGGFGKVYHGYIDKTEVAVKMLSSTSAQGFEQFQAEVRTLLTVHHRNLTSLVGYCIEGTYMGLIYEYMGRGNLRELLFADGTENMLRWEDRLRIALDAAQGLEYLHNGCKPQIIHRDVKSTNILSNEKLEAKLADFGLSKMFLADGDTHITTNVVGTHGYLDPEYHTTFRLTEKSDVYSFGIVILELITRRAVIAKDQEKSHIGQWVGFKLAQGDVRDIIDPNLEGDYNVSSVWKAVEIAMACVSYSSSRRPTMSQVVAELKECLAVELALAGTEYQTELEA